MSRSFLGAIVLSLITCTEPSGPSAPAAPTSVTAIPGPFFNEITIMWPPVPGAVDYNVYWGTTPGVTPRNGTMVVNAGPGPLFTHNGLTSNTTYHYVVTSVGVNNIEGPASLETQATASGDIGLRMYCPTVAALGGADLSLAASELDVAVEALSRFQIRGVTASVGGHSTDLVLNQFSTCGSAGSLRWEGTISLDGIPKGPTLLTIAATDAFGSIAAGSVYFLHGDPPALTITAPESLSVARPTLRVAASCVNEDLKGCASVTVAVAAGQPPGNGPFLAVGAPGVDQTVSLAAYDGQSVTLMFQGTDSAGRATTAYRPVFVESSPLLTEVTSVSGSIVDVQTDRILFLHQSAGSNELEIHDRVSGSDVVIYNQMGHVPERGYLTPLGAMFIERDVNNSPTLHEWRSGVLSDLGVNADVVVKGRYAVFLAAGRQLIARDIVADVNTTVAVPGFLDNFDGASNGDVVYSSLVNTSLGFQVYRFRNGTSMQLTNDSPQSNRLPKTDGVNVVYRKALNAGTFPIALYDPAGEHILSTTGTTYQATDGWVTYDKAGQIWTRSPAGEERQVTRFVTASRFEAVGPGGEIVALHGRRYYAVPDYSMPPRDIGSGLGTAFFQNGSLFVFIGRSLFQVSP